MPLFIIELHVWKYCACFRLPLNCQLLGCLPFISQHLIRQETTKQVAKFFSMTTFLKSRLSQTRSQELSLHLQRPVTNGLLKTPEMWIYFGKIDLEIGDMKAIDGWTRLLHTMLWNPDMMIIMERDKLMRFQMSMVQSLVKFSQFITEDFSSQNLAACGYHINKTVYPCTLCTLMDFFFSFQHVWILKLRIMSRMLQAVWILRTLLQCPIYQSRETDSIYRGLTVTSWMWPCELSMSWASTWMNRSLFTEMPRPLS